MNAVDRPALQYVMPLLPKRLVAAFLLTGWASAGTVLDTRPAYPPQEFPAAEEQRVIRDLHRWAQAPVCLDAHVSDRATGFFTQNRV